jgi:putative membrane protein
MSRFLPLVLTVAVGLVLGWSAIAPFDRFTWWLEVAPALAGLAVLAGTWHRLRLTDLGLCLIALHMMLLAVGGHYTYARVPLGEWFRQIFDLGRNHYDRLGHFAQGFVPAIIGREILIRNRVVTSRGWLAFLVVCVCLAISAVYELVEWVTALSSGAAANDFLGTQGDVWDTQTDMAFAGFGAIVALSVFSRWHDRQIARLDSPSQSCS